MQGKTARPIVWRVGACPTRTCNASCYPSSCMTGLFDFPSVVNEKAARAVAGCVLILSAITLATGFYLLAGLMAAGFALRVGWGPRFSSVAKLATRVIAPRLGEEKPVP